ncbi:MAG: hypothetical protein U0521_17025 [Anaerolineae bacterium]
MPEHSAADWALRQVEAVRDDPARRLELLERTYHGPTGEAPHHLPFRRAAMAFMRWTRARGVLAPSVGSAWWRAVNERLLRDGCEAVARSGGRGGAPSSPTIDLWMAFIADPRRHTWYRAHNATIVSAYLESRHLAEQENAAERFFLNVVLLRVLYAHALVSAPRLALGLLSGIAPLLGDPRLAFTGIFLSLARIVPGRYPLERDLREYVAEENPLGQLLDYGIIQPRLQRLYEWSAQELGEPGVLGLVRDGIPVYAWSFENRDVWEPARPTRAVRALRRILPSANEPTEIQ